MNKIIPPLLIAAAMALAVGCEKTSDSSISSEQSESDVTVEIVTTEEIITTETQPVVTTTVTTIEATEAAEIEAITQEVSGYTEIEIEIVEAVCIDLGYSSFMEESYPVRDKNDEFHVYKNYADYIMKTAETFPERCLGSISGEDDLTEKARTLWIERLGAEYIEYVEREYVEVDGVKMKLERHNPPYKTEYYEEHDVWYIVPNPPSGKREDGVSIEMPWDCPPYFLIRGEDGTILGASV